MIADPDFCFYAPWAEHPVQTIEEPVPPRIAVETFRKKTAPRLRDMAVLTLDCYGTLVDRETGIVSALMPWLHDVGVTASRGEILRAFSQAERARLQAATGLAYRDVLVEVHDALAEFFAVPGDRQAAKAFAASIRKWPVHSDVPEALAYLKEHFQLVVLTNTDHASFSHTNEALGVEFDAVFTAEDIGSFKPSVRSFEFLLGSLADAGIAREQVMHVAGSLRFDHVPAKRLDMTTCWIHRRPGRLGSSDPASRGIDVRPDLHFDSLGALADAHWAEVESACC